MTNKKYFFIGIGGVGMSSIAQYLYEKENTILGYDASENKLVKILEKKVDFIKEDFPAPFAPHKSALLAW